MPNQDQLSTLVTAFELWRTQRNGCKVPTPIVLREQAVALLHLYSSSQIRTALRISGAQLKQWRNTAAPTDTTPQFIQLPITTSPPSSVNVELCFACGDQMHLSGVVDSDLLLSLVGAMKS
jgi:hypothetical protein